MDFQFFLSCIHRVRESDLERATVLSILSELHHEAYEEELRGINEELSILSELHLGFLVSEPLFPLIAFNSF